MTSNSERRARVADVPIDPLFLERWSPVAFKPTPIPQADIESLFEAARWAPSSFNEQPWRFVYAHTEELLPKFRELLVDKNRVWADRAPFLMFVFAKRHFTHNGKPNISAAFDTGAATVSFSYQAQKLGLHTHAMVGIHFDRVYSELGVGVDQYEAVCAVVAGYHDPEATLPEELARREQPSTRKSRHSSAQVGSFGAE